MNVQIAARRCGWPNVVLLFLFVAAPVARADLFGLAFSNSFGPTVVRYTDDGRYAGTVPANYGESLDGLDSSADGRLYFVSNTLGRGALIAMDPPYTQATTSFINLHGLEIPNDVTLDAAGRVYTASNQFSSSGRTGVFCYDPTDRTTTFTPARAGNGFIGGVAVAPNGDVFVGRDHGNNAPRDVERYDGVTGAFLGSFVPDPTRMSYSDMEFGPDGNLYVETNEGINRYRPGSGALIDTFIPVGAADFGTPGDFDFAGDGLVYVNSRSTSRVLRFDAATGQFRGDFIAPDQYAAGANNGLGSITVVVPEPAAVGLSLVLLLPYISACGDRSGR